MLMRATKRAGEARRLRRSGERVELHFLVETIATPIFIAAESGCIT